MVARLYSNLLDSLFVASAKPMLDKQCTKYKPYWVDQDSSGGIELRGICIHQLFPWHQRGEGLIKFRGVPKLSAISNSGCA